MVTRAGSRGEAPLAFTNSQLESLCFSSHDDGFFTVSAMTNLIMMPPINPLTPKMFVEGVLAMLVKFGGVAPYLLGKSGLARETSIKAW